MCAPREDREADGVGVLLDHRLDDLLRRLVQAGVDDLHAGVAQRAGDDLRAAVVPVEAGLGDDDADLAGWRSGCDMRRGDSSCGCAASARPPVAARALASRDACRCRPRAGAVSIGTRDDRDPAQRRSTTSFLRVGDAAAHMHVAWRGRFRPPLGAVPITRRRACARSVAGRLAAAPRFRQRLAVPARRRWASPCGSTTRRLRRRAPRASRARRARTSAPDRARFARAVRRRGSAAPLPRDRPLWTPARRAAAGATARSGSS